MLIQYIQEKSFSEIKRKYYTFVIVFKLPTYQIKERHQWWWRPGSNLTKYQQECLNLRESCAVYMITDFLDKSLQSFLHRLVSLQIAAQRIHPILHLDRRGWVFPTGYVSRPWSQKTTLHRSTQRSNLLEVAYICFKFNVVTFLTVHRQILPVKCLFHVTAVTCCKELLFITYPDTQ